MRALYKRHSGVGLKFDADRPKPKVGPRDVLTRVKKAGICGTDRHIWEWDAWAAGRIPVGIVTGHEFVGTIEEVGSAVTKYHRLRSSGLENKSMRILEEALDNAWRAPVCWRP